jgi:spore coat polysaccharide biosynthesis protein SpsF
MKLGFVIQARMGSTRLPGKVLLDFCGKPMLQFQIDLLRSFNFSADIVVATSHNSIDIEIEEFCESNNIKCARGSENNVFRRFQDVAIKYGFEHIIRLTGDNPLPNQAILTEAITTHGKFLPDITSTRRVNLDHTIDRFTAKGQSVDVINCNTLLNIDSLKLSSFEQEHVIPIFFKKPYLSKFIKVNFNSELSLSIDSLEDFKRVSNYTKSLYPKHRFCST